MRTSATLFLTLCGCVSASAHAASIINEMDADTIVAIHIGGEEVLAASGLLITYGDAFELPTEPNGPQDLLIRFESEHECTIAGVDFSRTPELVISAANCAE